jgi:methyl-accepting chemotaxis protein
MSGIVPGSFRLMKRAAKLNNLPIIAKFMAVMALFGLFSLGTAFYAAHQMQTIDDRYSALIGGNGAASVDVARANRSLIGMEAGIAELMAAETPAGNIAAKALLDHSTAELQHFVERAAQEAPAQADSLRGIEARAEDLVTNQCALAITEGASSNAGTAAGTAATNEYFNNCAPYFPPVVAAFSAAVDTISTATNTVSDSLTATTENTVLITYSGVIGGMVLVMALGFFAITAWLVTPVKRLQAVMGKLAQGDLAADVPGTERKDEVGGMARAVQVFKDNGLEKVRLEDNLKIAQAKAEAERLAAAELQAQAAERQQEVVESLATGLASLADGDLLFRLNQSFAAEYEKLRNDFNGAMDRLAATMTAITTNTQGVRAGAGEITQASDDLSRRTEQQAASLEQTAAALDQITTTVRKTATSASEARTVANNARGDAESSAKVVTQTVSAMHAIESSSDKITSIIGVIDEIAFQTNLLALNAGIEAARAGDAGRGFAVVATEVRALAQRSAEAAKEIKTLISASSDQVVSGVKLVGETGKSLTRIVEHVSQLNHLVNEIAASAQEQASGLAQVNIAVNQMDQATQQNAAMVEQSTAASHSLVGEAQALTELVGQFRTADSTGAGNPSQHAAIASKRPAAKLALVHAGE